ncbi:ATP-dependent endonuclease [Variovorax sp. YR216]|uniref:ATP-dependent nuclease n=1 Tax=Variovorax sp. YR216 TaxID=1882828 RepID=UPI000896773F|nr:AAA family ATPase [Variovorax sp. YR216]SEB26489.1 putative ATP-dependent endonuclease of the OLD family [Variovorax sp. YR216]
MRLSEVTINNFCSCHALTVPLSGFNPIVGYNNSGKSNILRAINWLLKKSVLPSHMFHDAAMPVTVEGVIDNVNLNLLPPNQQQAVAPYLHGGALKCRRRQDSPGSTAAQIRIDVFNFQANAWVDNPAGLDTALGVLFPEPLHIAAMEDAGEDVSKFGAKNTLGLLLKQVLARINANNAAALNQVQASLAQVSGHLNGANRLVELGEFEAEATAAIASFFPGLSLHLNFGTPNFEDLFKSSTVTLSDVQGFPRPFASFGHGAQRSSNMALIKLLADLTGPAAGNPAGTVVLLIDEPELYLHPQAIELLREALLQLSTQNFQVIFSTHSPLLIGRTHALQALMIHKDAAGRTAARQKLLSAANDLAAHPHHAEAVFSLQTAAHLLFSDRVLLVEGKTELMLLPQLYQTLRGHSYAHDKGCIVSGFGSSALLPMMQILRAVGFHPKALADLDFAFRIAAGAGAGLIPPGDTSLAACKTWFAGNAAPLGFYLDSGGLPAKKDQHGNFSALTPAEAFERMAAAMPHEVANIAQTLRAQDIWVWSAGAIEAHLGIGKNDTARINFLNSVVANGNLNHAQRPQDIHDLAMWM